MPKITALTCNKYLNSRAEWTIKTTVALDNGVRQSQIVPEGASKGDNEALSLPVDKAIPVVSGTLNAALTGKEATDQKHIDEVLKSLDGTSNKKHLGGNSLLSVSLAVAKAAAVSQNLELYEYVRKVYEGFNTLEFPTPVFNVLNGGLHAPGGASFQEFLIIPAKYVPYDTAVEIGVDVYQALKEELSKKGLSTGLGDEGGFASRGFTTEQALLLIKTAANKKHKVGDDVFLGLDVAANSFYKHSNYHIPEEKLKLSEDDLYNYHSRILSEFELIYMEDPFAEGDTKNWQQFTKSYSQRLMVVADDLVVTNPKILKEVIDGNLANAVIVKPNQIGTLSETMEFVKEAKKANMAITVSHRSGDTAEDTFIADLAVAIGADFIKSGAPARGERTAKYNRLLDIFYRINA